MSDKKISFVDIAALHEPLHDEIMQALSDTIRSGGFILGPTVKKFEEAFAAYLGVKHCVGVNSGTDALTIALRAAGVGEGDEVICPSWSFFATGESISQIGAIPVFCDVELDSMNIDPDQIEALITERTKAIVPVHIYGRIVEMERIFAIAEKHNLVVVEDTAQATGARRNGKFAGGHGLGAFSFFPTKPLGGVGDGGMVALDDDEHARIARMLRAHGGQRKYHNEILGYNSRLDAMQAAVLSVKLPHLDDHNHKRHLVVRKYEELLGDIDTLVLPDAPEDGTHVLHQYTTRVLNGDRDGVQDKLAQNGVPTMIYYPVPIHRLPVYQGPDAAPSICGPLDVTEQLARESMSLPIWPGMPDEEIEYVATQVRAALGA